MEKMGLCKTCRYFVDGECRCNPPAPRDYAYGVFPKVRETDCCGCHDECPLNTTIQTTAKAAKRGRKIQ